MDADHLKRNPPSSPPQPLTDTDLHVWYASLKRPQPELDRLFVLLSPDEKERADRFHFERDRNRFIAGRGLLRTLLGDYLEMDASQIQFVYGASGKPALNPAFHEKALEFNVSHSNDLVAYIFHPSSRVGIDLEYIRPMPDMDDFARQFFSPRESAFINSLDQKQDAFFKIWTCKEAFFKASGEGLTVPLDQVEITLTTEGSARLVSVDGINEEAVPWHLETFRPAENYQLSLAVERHNVQITIQDMESLQ